jgi:FkbM family methyltransferase
MNEIAKIALPVTMRPCRFGWVMYPSTDQYIGGCYATYGEYSPVEVKFVQGILRPGDVVVNAGAHIGSLAIPMGRSVGPQGKVIAFEPQGFLWTLLKANLAINGVDNIDAVYAAVGKECGQVKIPMINYAKGDNYGGVGREVWKQYDDDCCSTVELVTIDSLGLPRLDLLQADVETMEKEVLEGAKETIEKYRPKLFIENDKVAQFVELIEYVEEIEYVPYWVVTWLHVKNNFYETDKNLFPGACSFNMYCIPKERPDWMIEGLRIAKTTDSPQTCLHNQVIETVEFNNA